MIEVLKEVVLFSLILLGLRSLFGARDWFYFFVKADFFQRSSFDNAYDDTIESARADLASMYVKQKLHEDKDISESADQKSKLSEYDLNYAPKVQGLVLQHLHAALSKWGEEQQYIEVTRFKKIISAFKIETVIGGLVFPILATGLYEFGKFLFGLGV